MADGIIEEEIVKITVDDKELEDLPRKMGAVTARMNQYLTLTSGVAERTGDQWTKTAADMLKSTMSVGDATNLLATQLKTKIPNGAKAVEVAIKIMDKTLTQTMASMMESNIPMEEMERSFKRIGVTGEDFTRILGVAQSQLAETPKAIMPAIEGIKELGEAMGDVSPERLFTAKGKGLVSTISQMYEMGKSTEEIAQAFVDVGRTGRDVQTAMVKVNDSVAETTEAFEKLELATKKTDWSPKGIAASVEWAAYQFLFSLAIYMGFRKVIRWINEAITESIKLFRELAKAMQTLATNVEMNTRIIGDSIGTLKEWQKWVQDTQRAWKTTSQAVLDAANNALQANATLRMSAEELRDVIELGRAVAIMYSEYKDGQLNVAKGVEIVTNAIAGQESAMLQLGFTLDDVIKYFNRVSESVDITKDEFGDLPDAMQASIVKAYIIAERFDDISKSAQSVVHPVEAFTTTLDAAITEQKADMGVFLAFFTQLPKFVELGGLAIADFATTLMVKLNPNLQRTVAFMSMLLFWAQRSVSVQNELSEASEEGGQAAIDSASAWSKFVDAADHARTVAEKAKRILDAVRGIQEKVKDAVNEAAEAFVNLGKAIADAIMESDRARTQAGVDYWKDYNETFEDQKKDELKLEERYADKADDLRKRAADKIADLRKRATEEEENDRADLLLRLHQMEEDYQLSMKQLYEQTALDIEEAARSRDWRAIRTIQRRYALEKKQRKEDYDLQQHQTIESWEARHKDTQKNLDEEIKEIQDSLAIELAELEAEKAEELQGIKDNWDERRQELLDQYNQELADLQAALDRRLAEGITEWAEQNNIPLEAVKAVVIALAKQYGLDADNLWNNLVLPELEMHQMLVDSWANVIKAYQGQPTLAIKKPTFTLGKKTPIDFATGGMAIATAPTLVRVGEAGPELFTAIPLARGGSVLGGARGYAGGDFHLSIDGNQTGLWSSDFERGVEHTVAKIFKEAFQE